MYRNININILIYTMMLATQRKCLILVSSVIFGSLCLFSYISYRYFRLITKSSLMQNLLPLWIKKNWPRSDVEVYLTLVDNKVISNAKFTPQVDKELTKVWSWSLSYFGFCIEGLLHLFFVCIKKNRRQH